MKRMASEFQGQFMDAMREADMADLRKEAQKLADSAKIDVGLPTMHDLTRDLEAKPAMRPLPPAIEGPGDEAPIAHVEDHHADVHADAHHAAREPSPDDAEQRPAPSLSHSA